MKSAWLLAALMIAWGGVAAQEKKRPAAKKAPLKTGAAHTKATPEQIRKFNELEKKQQR